MGMGQEREVPSVAIKGQMVEVGAPIQLVAETDVQEFNWLEGGQYLVYMRDAHPEREGYIPTRDNPSLWQRIHENALYLYDTTTRRTTLLHRNNIDFWAVALNGKALLYAVGEQIRRTDEPGDPFAGVIISARTILYLRQPSQAPPKVILQLNGEQPQFSLSPGGKYLAIGDSATQVLELPTGRIVRRFEKGTLFSYWASDTVLCLRRYREDGSNHYFAYDVRDDSLRPLSEADYTQMMVQVAEKDTIFLRKETPNLRLQPNPIPTEAPSPAVELNLHSLTAQTERLRKTTVAHDADPRLYSLAPNESGVAYCSWRGQLFYIPLTKRDPKTLPEKLACGEKLKDEDLRQYYLSNGKQIAMAAIMYCQDYDETFPPSSDVVNRLMPYIKNGEVFLDAFTGQMTFTYLLDGQSLANIERLAETPLGRLDWGDPEVIVVLYADGHVKLERRK